MLSLFTLCLRVCSNICGTNGPDRRCCVLHCALSIQCCCEWKAGRLRIIPDSPDGLRGRPGVDHAQASTAVVGSPATRRAALYPPPPPADLEIFPTGSNSNQNNNNNSTNGEDSTSATTNHHSSATGGRGSSSNTEGASTRQLHSRNNSTGDAISTLSANITTGNYLLSTYCFSEGKSCLENILMPCASLKEKQSAVRFVTSTIELRDV